MSHETIYQSLFVQGRGALRKELHTCLRTGRAMRRAKAYTKGGVGQGQIRNMVMISERPAEEEDRAVLGHWEGDLIFGRKMTSIGTLVERHSRYVILLKLPHGDGAESVRKAMTERILTLPAELRRSVTWDQGKEMAEHVSAGYAPAHGLYVQNGDLPPTPAIVGRMATPGRYLGRPGGRRTRIIGLATFCLLCPIRSLSDCSFYSMHPLSSR